MSEFLFTVLVFAVFITAMFLLYNNVCIVKKYKVETDKLCGSLKIVLVSDFHNSRRLYRSVMRKIKSCEPDVIIISGDLVDRRKPDFDTARKFLGALRSFADLYYVTGNHEAALGLDGVIKELDCADILLDEKYKIFESFSVLGLSDRAAGDAEKRSDLLSVFEKLDNFKIAIVHRPTEFDRNLKISDYDIDLVLCGHNHGGLIRIPFFGALVSPDEGFFPKYSKGIYRENGRTMVVSGGAGNTFLPLRLNNFPEIVCISAGLAECTRNKKRKKEN